MTTSRLDFNASLISAIKVIAYVVFSTRFCRIQTQIVREEGKHADHLTTTAQFKWSSVILN